MRPKSKWLRIGSVRVFDEVEPSKAQALKVSEEAFEVYGAWQLTHLPEDKRRLRMIDGCCDTIMAACNLLAALAWHGTSAPSLRATARLCLLWRLMLKKRSRVPIRTSTTVW